MPHPLAKCLIEYGADPVNIPREGSVDFDTDGIYVLEFEKDDGEPILMESGSIVLVQVFYPHPDTKENN